MTKIVLLSDTHEHNLRTKWQIPSADIVIHAGDITARGSIESLKKVGRELASLPARFKIVVPGNHDRIFARFPREATALLAECGVITLIDELIELPPGIRIYGTPRMEATAKQMANTPFIAFSSLDCYKHYARIPADIHILVTHVPPSGIMDVAEDGESLGSPQLSSQIGFRILPQLHVFGHVHEGHGVQVEGPTTFVNASMCNNVNVPELPPHIVEWSNGVVSVQEVQCQD
jgi:Icc-related predicted phosphoesterase